MKILVAGARGLIGSRLVNELLARGYANINILSTHPMSFDYSSNQTEKVFSWNPELQEIDYNAFSGVDVVVNLAGEPIANQRWTKRKKERIISSRVNGTKLILDAIRDKPIKIINASAIGIYGGGFLSEVCKEWEKLLPENSMIIRIGLVLSAEGGILKKMLMPFKMGLGGTIGHGQQYMSWIHIEDLINIIIWGIEHQKVSGVFDAVSLCPVTNREFTKILSKVLKRVSPFYVPRFALKAIFGEMSELLLHGQRVVPKRLLDCGFKFKFHHLQDALEDLLK